jgi:endonuclease G
MDPHLGLCTGGPTSSAYVQDLELPLYQKGELVVHHPGYTLLYDEEHEQARWVAYHLSREELYGSHDRGDDFRADPSIPTGSAALDDYRSSGYDRGHLIPAADLSWSQEAMSASFFLSNMSPQAVNSTAASGQTGSNGSNFADTEGVCYVCPYGLSLPTAVQDDRKEPGFSSQRLLQGGSGLSGAEYKGAIGFCLPTRVPKGICKRLAVRVDVVEEVTGIDFFPPLVKTERRVCS